MTRVITGFVVGDGVTVRNLAHAAGGTLGLTPQEIADLLASLTESLNREDAKAAKKKD